MTLRFIDSWLASLSINMNSAVIMGITIIIFFAFLFTNSLKNLAESYLPCALRSLRFNLEGAYAFHVNPIN